MRTQWLITTHALQPRHVVVCCAYLSEQKQPHWPCTHDLALCTGLSDCTIKIETHTSVKKCTRYSTQWDARWGWDWMCKHAYYKITPASVSPSMTVYLTQQQTTVWFLCLIVQLLFFSPNSNLRLIQLKCLCGDFVQKLKRSRATLSYSIKIPNWWLFKWVCNLLKSWVRVCVSAVLEHLGIFHSLIRPKLLIIINLIMWGTFLKSYQRWVTSTGQIN